MLKHKIILKDKVRGPKSDGEYIDWCLSLVILCCTIIYLSLVARPVLPSIDEELAQTSTLERKREKVRVLQQPTDLSLDSIEDTASEASSIVQIPDPEEELPEPDLDQELGDDVSINELVSVLFVHVIIHLHSSDLPKWHAVW